MRDNIPPEDDEAPETSGHIAYAHRPKPISSGLALVLGHDTLRAERGRSVQSVPLKAIERISLAFTPKNATQRAFTCTLQVSDGRRLSFHNVSWKSLIEAQRLDTEFTGFVTQLIRRVHAANPDMVLHAGVSSWRYGLMMISGAIIVLGLAALAILAMVRQNTIVGLLSLGMTAYLAYWLKEFLTRNRPRLFTPDIIPPEILP